MGCVPHSELSQHLFAELATQVECHSFIFQGATCKGERNIGAVSFRCFGANLQQSVRTSDGAQLLTSIELSTNGITNVVVILRQFLIVFGVSFRVQNLSAHIIVGAGETNVDGLREFLTDFAVSETNTILQNLREAMLQLGDSDRLTNREGLQFSIHQIFQVGTVRNAQGSFNQLPTGSFVLPRFGERSEVSYLQLGSDLQGVEHRVRC